MKIRIMMLLFMTLAAMGAVRAGDAAQGRPVPYKVIPMDMFAAAIKNWSNEEDPHYAIMGHAGEWEANFIPTRTMGNNQKPVKPDAALFRGTELVAVSRVSDAPPPGAKVLEVRSLVIDGGELILTYVFTPPAQQASYKVKNTLLVAIPAQAMQNGIRFVEEIETPATRAAAAELDEARRMGRVKPPPMQGGGW